MNSTIPPFFCALATGGKWLIRPGVFLILCTTIYLVVTLLATAHSANTIKGQKDLTEGDSKAYLRQARSFAEGDFSLYHVQDKPHRQPLYPMLLVPSMKATGGDLFWLAVPNVIFGLLTFFLIYWGVFRLFRSPFAAAAVGFLFLINPFVCNQITRHLLTEPLHLLFMMGVIFSLLIYLRGKNPAWLLVAAMLTGFEYLARVNGLFVMASLMGSVVLGECLEWLFARQKKISFPVIFRHVALYAAAVAVFLIISAPSWVPRLRQFGDPFYHGYLSNYMWVDTYKEGHTGDNFAQYTWRDYAATHDFGDVVSRAAHGIWEVGFDIPTQIEKPPILFILSLAGAFVALWRGPLSLRVVFIFGVVQLLPLMWTHLSNPTTRVPYAASLPFELFFAAVFLTFVATQPWGEWWRDREKILVRLKRP